MKLNPAKCSFGVAAGKFLGYMVTQCGIEANLYQIRSVVNIPSPACIRDVQRLAGRVAALSRFISRSFEKYHLFFSTLRKSKDFEWTPACEKHYKTSRSTSLFPHSPPSRRMGSNSSSNSQSLRAQSALCSSERKRANNFQSTM